MIEHPYKDKTHNDKRMARMELRGSSLLVFCDDELISQVHIFHPGMIRHIHKTEEIKHVIIENKDWMLREVINIIEEDAP